MTEILRIYSQDKLNDIDLTDKTAVNVDFSEQGDYQILDGERRKASLQFKRIKDIWQYKCAVELQNEEKNGQITPLKIYVCSSPKIAFALYDVDYNCMETIDISGEKEITIGRRNDCEIVLANRQISGHHARLARTASGWRITDLDSANGTYINGVKMASAEIADGDCVDIGSAHLVFTGSSLSIRFTGTMEINFPVYETVRPFDEQSGYPFLFRRSPRIRREVKTETIEIQTAPGIGAAPSINWLSVILPPLSTLVIMGAMAVIFSFSKTSLLFSGPMAIIGLLVTIFNYRSQKKKYNETENLRLSKYNEYLDEVVVRIKEGQADQRSILLEAHPNTSDCISIVSEMERRLWERRAQDADFLTLRIGSGDVASSVSLRIPKELLTLEKDSLSSVPAEIEKSYARVSECPITWDVLRDVTGGVVGDRACALRLTRNLILQAAAHHSYDELKIIMLCSEEEWPEWQFVRWLPHTFDETRTHRYIATDRQSADRLLTQLQDMIQQRLRELEQSRDAKRIEPKMPYLLFICADYELLQAHSILDFLTKNDPNTGIGALFLFDCLERLPKECNTILEIGGGHGAVYHRENAADRHSFTMDTVSSEKYDVFARAMAPIRLEERGRQELPVSVTFLQGIGVKRADEINIAEWWADSSPNKSMAVPIGVRANGEPFRFDIHEKQHGPHGLVAGMTGSGKSEMVQSWILSMALRFPPQDVSFVLIDFKGTGLILPFQNLPHLAGTISDLDANIGRNLIALENELSRRKALLDQYGVSNISSYIKLRQEGKAAEPLSYLFVVIDEFAEFKVQFPDFIQVVNRIFAIGRTLGVSIVLLTQKPTNVVDDKMNANTRFRWCLKVASSADSKDMLGHPDAAKITNPGRAFIQVGEDEIFEPIQSYWSGAPYNPYRDLSHRGSTRISVVDLQGNRIHYDTERTTGYRAERNEIDAVVEHIDTYVRKHSMERAKNIWTQKLSSVVYLRQIVSIAFDGERWTNNEDKLQVTIGMIDDPRSQSQYPAKLDLSGEGHISVFGAPGTGKTTLLQTSILSLALSYSPEFVHIYAMDFGGGNLRIFENLPHVGGIAQGDEEEKIDKLALIIQAEIRRRKKCFSECGAMSIGTYRELTGETLPYLILVLDNFAPVLNLYPNLDNFFIDLSREGGTYGVYWLVSATTQTALTYRVNQNIKMSLALRMADRADYSTIVGRTDGLEPENTAGRGLVKGNPPLEFQTALPAEGESERERLTALRKLVAMMKEKWTGGLPAPIPVMPETITLERISGDGIGIGLATSDVSRVSFDPIKTPFTLISEKTGVVKKGLLKAMTCQLTKVASEIILYDPSESTANIIGENVRHITRADEFDRFIAELMPVMQERKQQRQSGDRKPFELLGIVVLDLKSCFDAISDETAKRLNLLITLGRPLGVILFAAGTSEDLAKLYHGGDPFTISLVDQGAAILLGGNLRAHSAFKPDVPYTELENPLSKYEGYFLRDEKAIKFKSVYQE